MVTGWPSTRATALMLNESSIGVSLNNCSKTASGEKALLHSMMRLSPESPSVRSTMSEIPCSFLLTTRSFTSLNHVALARYFAGSSDYHYAPFAWGDLFDPGPRPNLESSLAGFVSVTDSIKANNDPTGGKVRTWNKGHEFFERGLRGFRGGDAWR